MVMSQIYAAAHIVHLFCAVIFVGGVFFEGLVLSVLHTKKVSREARREVEKAVSSRVTKIMPPVVITLFLSGLVMLHRYAAVLSQPFATPFNTQLALKLLLAISVLVHFVIAVTKMRRKTLTAAWSKYIHAAVFIHMLGIVFLAKSMFYLSW